ncbi:MAG: hypothetical protein E6J39_04795 [Chloroflexi bacterium]|nr:MAG: hypothetical protein E6J39_04795 [Chloroflexota bacterium]
MHRLSSPAVAIAALPYVNWIFWAALAAGSLLVVGVTELMGGTTRGYRLFMAGMVAVCAAVLLASELNLPSGVPAARTADVRRTLVWLFAGTTLVYLVASIANWPRAGLAVLAGLIGLAAMVSLAVAGGSASGGLFAIQLVLAAAALGSVAASMLLGHWYLVTPSLSPRPLRRMVWWLVGTLAAQALAFGVAVATIPGEALSGPMGWLTWLRLGAGTLLPIGIGLLAILASRAASLQASTGLLYIGLALVMAGSIAGASITYLTGVPV